ncbi:Crp/Fnr family transcriptional regulator [Salisediminibacterium halotolerans]|uniref:Crp/Fnr family transcriptional regulator n=1 Tax=Salisediminibacterium halotolerans TaxID=517425 RepID=UPI000EADF69B|nr:Crp/Fnr family transcriptional regulator [Salisediminibacterium halotolerans]RLJ78312.1 CRP/FNR family transcriptional regulator [Actinophytocola xinjiangensis]RPE88349.1 CRP/FNR family transcriptional regulator [Salisediminibacterium halotolerans]TWG37288.1 CRP/FNR family transcriptional regulator [Salisediminibacterium halotolerans]GEL08751.1 hypothetical protein SHA02_21670 [Salisediminibacterium halotolerans]
MKSIQLTDINLWDFLSEEEAGYISLKASLRKLEKGELISSPAMKNDQLFFLKEGQVRLYRMNQEGRQFTIDILVGGSVFGQTDRLVITDEKMFVEAMVRSAVFVMNKETFDLFLLNHPHAALKFIKILSEKLKFAADIAEQIALNDLRCRIIFLLLKFTEKTGRFGSGWEPIPMHLTHYDLAMMAGSTRESVSAVMSELKKDGLVQKNRGCYSVQAERLLEEVSQVLIETNRRSENK